MIRHCTAFFALLLLIAPAAARAQVTLPKGTPVVYGHHHINPTDPAAHRKFWVDTLGGSTSKIGPRAVIQFPGVVLILTANKPTGGTKTSSVNHIGFGVQNLRAMVDRMQAAGYPIVTRAELPPIYATGEKDGIAPIPDQNTSVAFVMGPDDTKVELVEVKTQSAPVTMHHVHFATQQVPEMTAWYAKTFGLTAGKRGAFDNIKLPADAHLTFSPSPAPVVPTKGRVLDHIGFEIRGLEAFTKTLETAGITLTVPYRQLPDGLKIAFFVDPWGTYVELTEGLAKAE